MREKGATGTSKYIYKPFQLRLKPLNILQKLSFITLHACARGKVIGHVVIIVVVIVVVSTKISRSRHLSD